MDRPGLVLTLWVVALWVLLFFVLGDGDGQKGEPPWTPPRSDGKGNVFGPAW